MISLNDSIEPTLAKRAHIFQTCLNPRVVRVDRIPEPEGKPVDWNDPSLDFARYSRSGVIGGPTHATADLGAKLWDATVEAVASMFREIAKAEIATDE